MVVSLRSFCWEMPQKLFLQLGIGGGEGSVQVLFPEDDGPTTLGMKKDSLP